MASDAKAQKFTIAVVGSGVVGGHLGKLFAKQGHTIIFGSRDPDSDKIKNLVKSAPNSKAAGLADAVAEAGVVLLTTPFTAAEEVVKSLELKGKVLIDATNPIGAGLSLSLGTNTCAGEQVAKWAPGAKVVKCFNTIGQMNYSDPVFDNQKADMFICSDDAGAKQIAMQLAGELGFNPVDCGNLAHARWTEALAMLWITLTYKQGWGTNHAFKILRRQNPT